MNPENLGESRIVWLVPIDDLPYVRETLIEDSRRRGRVRAPGDDCKVVGYSELKTETESRYPASDFYRRHTKEAPFFRRVFWLKPHDRVNEPDGCYKVGCPMEAVDPRTVAPNVRGIMTAQAWGKADVSDAELELRARRTVYVQTGEGAW